VTPAENFKPLDQTSAEREPDSVLVERALKGEADAFATLFRIHRARVYAVCLRMTNNPADADDLTQEAFIQAFRKLSTFRGESALSTWLHRVAVNTALMHFRRQSTSRANLESTTGEREGGHREFGQQDDRLHHSLDRIALTRALESLPYGYRTIFELHEIGGYGHREIAKLLRCSVGNSKSQLHKAKQRIREALVSRTHFSKYVRGGSKTAANGSKQPFTKNTPNTELTLNLLVGRSHESLANTSV
jgi:RNA polymerase sigma-70 factor, ECF subfamily